MSTRNTYGHAARVVPYARFGVFNRCSVPISNRVKHAVMSMTPASLVIAPSPLIRLQQGLFEAIIFDCDGTLVDTLGAHLRAFQEALQPYGIAVTRSWCEAHSGQSPATVVAAIEGEIAPLPVAHETVLKAYVEGFHRNLHLLQEVEAVAAVARQWKGRVPMAVASNGRKINVLATLGSVGLLTLFDTVVAIEDVAKGKPEPDLFLEAARQMGVAPEHCLVLEDSQEGIRAADRAGMGSILVTAPLFAECAVNKIPPQPGVHEG